MRYFLLFAFFWSWILPLQATVGTILLSNGKSFHGRLTLSQPVQLQDIVTKKYVSLALAEIYRIALFQEAVILSLPWKGPAGKSQSVTEKRYLMCVSDWAGRRYWGYFNTRVTLHETYRKRKFTIAPIQVPQNLQLEDLFYVKEITCEPPENLHVPDEDSRLTLCGRIAPSQNFTEIYAIHNALGVIFPGTISQEGGWYDIHDLLPGSYDLILVGPQEIIFSFSMPIRKNLLDKDMTAFSYDFTKWVETQQSHVNRKLLYMTGRQSNTRALVAEEFVAGSSPKNENVALPAVPKERLFWLCLCFYNKDQWYLKNCQFLGRQEITQPWPNLLLDPKLGNVVIEASSGKIQYDCVWE